MRRMRTEQEIHDIANNPINGDISPLNGVIGKQGYTKFIIKNNILNVIVQGAITPQNGEFKFELNSKNIPNNIWNKIYRIDGQPLSKNVNTTSIVSSDILITSDVNGVLSSYKYNHVIIQSAEPEKLTFTIHNLPNSEIRIFLRTSIDLN